MAVTGIDGALGRRVARLLADREVRGIDRLRGHELARPASYEGLLRGCAAIVHTAALHPLVAPASAGAREYREANVDPFEALVAVASREHVERIVLVSSTSVWTNADPGEPARFLDESVEADADDAYARSKRECERIARDRAPGNVIIRLARFARRGDPEDAVRLLYRAVDPDDAAAAVVAALDRAGDGALYAISAPTPFEPADAAELGRDPRSAIRRRTGSEPRWVPGSIGSVVRSDRATRELGWRAEFPSPFYR